MWWLVTLSGIIWGWYDYGSDVDSGRARGITTARNYFLSIYSCEIKQQFSRIYIYFHNRWCFTVLGEDWIRRCEQGKAGDCEMLLKLQEHLVLAKSWGLFGTWDMPSNFYFHVLGCKCKTILHICSRARSSDKTNHYEIDVHQIFAYHMRFFTVATKKTEKRKHRWKSILETC